MRLITVLQGLYDKAVPSGLQLRWQVSNHLTSLLKFRRLQAQLHRMLLFWFGLAYPVSEVLYFTMLLVE